MAWTSRQYSKNRINRAGDDLINLEAFDPAREESLTVINNWRSCHGYPLQAIKMTLLQRAKAADSEALIAQRLKRLPSIAVKLRDNPTMKLSQMQDVGGCRAILRRAIEVDKLHEVYKTYYEENKERDDRPVIIEEYDYIKSPKADGYRGIHLVHKYQSRHGEKKCFEGQRIEVQLRSQLQHAWATAVETSQAFTGQALKAKIKTASSPEWLRFFALMGSAIAARERRPLVPDTPTNKQEMREKLRKLASQERILDHLEGWNTAMHRLESRKLKGAHTFLLELDTAKKMLRINSFKADELLLAQQQYLDFEKGTESNPNIQLVLVRVDSVDALRSAYPNYYVDTSNFIEAVRHEIK